MSASGSAMLAMLRSVTVEPVVVSYLLPIALTSFATDNLNLDKACRVNLNLNNTVCEALARRELSGLESEEAAVQKLVAWVGAWRNILRYSLPAGAALFAGSWSDRRSRRKPLLLAPLAGELCTCVALLLLVRHGPLEAAGAAEGVFSALSGGGMVLTAATFSYVSDVTPPHRRTFRMGVVNAVLFACVPLGTALSGVLLSPLTFYGVFALGAALYVLGLLYTALVVKEPNPPKPRPPGVSFLRDFFDWRLVAETLGVLVRKREGTGRRRLLLIVLALVLVTGANFGESSLGYLFLRGRLLWTEVDASYYSTYAILVNLAGTLVASVLLSRIWGMEDATIAIMACVSKICGQLVYTFSYAGWLFYLGQVAEFLSGATVICLRAMASKAVPPEELGRVFSLLGVSEMLAPLVFGSLYSYVYTKTLEDFSGAFFLLGAGIILLAGLVLLYVSVLLRREKDATNEVPMQGGQLNQGFSLGDGDKKEAPEEGSDVVGQRL